MTRSRRDSNQLLADSIGDLYKRVEQCIKNSNDARQAVEDVFEAFKPLRELEDKYRGK